jgi:hypothetical protein
MREHRVHCTLVLLTLEGLRGRRSWFAERAIEG